MTERSLLLQQLYDLRELIDMPTDLSPWRIKIIRREAQRLGDRCWYYAGWYGAQSNQKASDVGETTLNMLLDRLARVIKIAGSHTRQNKVGHPGQMTFTDHLFALPEYELRLHSALETKTTIINDLVHRKMLDKKKSTESHVKRFDYALKKRRQNPK